MIAMVVAVMSASLLGSPHCAGMCGPFCGLAVSGGRGRAAAALLHAAYHGGRLLTYTTIGAAAGAAGALLDVASTLAGLQPMALGLAGAAMVLFGFAELARARGWKTPLSRFGNWRPPPAWTQLVQRGQRFAARRGPGPRALLIGMLTTLLPCGWLYAFFVTAAGSGGAVRGAIVMAAFWVGTLPVLLTLGVGVRKLTGVLGERLPLATATALIAVGLFTLSGRQSLSPTALATLVTAESSEATPADNRLPVGLNAAMPDPSATPACCRAADEAAQ